MKKWLLDSYRKFIGLFQKKEYVEPEDQLVGDRRAPSIPVIGSTKITTLGTITTGTWEATDVGVQHGGTGAGTFTDHGVMLGSGTGALSVTAVGTNGQVFTGNTGADPSWQAAAAAATITVADESADTECFPVFVTAATGALAPKSGTNLTFNSSTGAVTAPSFVGALTGQADTVATIAGLAPNTATTAAAQANITSLGTLTALGLNGDLTMTGTATNHILLPLNDDAATPTLSFGDGNTGFYESSDNNLKLAIAGSERWHFYNNGLGSSVTGRALLVNDNPSATLPVIVPANNDLDTGIGHAAADSLSLISGGVEAQRLTETLREIEANATVFQTDGGDVQVKTVAVHGLAVGSVVTFADGTGTVSTDITAGTYYYVTQVDSTTLFNISATRGGSNIAFADAGTAFTSNELGIVNTMGYGTAQTLLPFSNDATTPTLAFGDGDSGFYESADDTLNLALGGSNLWAWTNSYFGDTNGYGALLREVPTATNPILVPAYADDLNTGIGWAGADQLSLIAGGVEGIRIAEATAAITGTLTGTWDVTTALTVNSVAVLVSGGALGTPSAGTLTNCSGTAASLNIGGTAAVATAITVADESADDTCNVVFVTAATGNLPPKTGTNLTFASSTGLLTATGFAGALTGNADTVTTNANLTGVVTSSGNATSIGSGAIKANMLQATGTDLGAAHITVDLSNTNGAFVTHLTTDGTITGGTLTDGTLTGSAGTYTGGVSITSTTFVGALTGNATGSSGSCTGNSATVTGFTPASGSLTLAGADAVTITTTGATNSTLPLGTKTLAATDVATLSSLTSVGALNSGSITSGFGAINNAAAITGTVLTATAASSLVLGTASSTIGGITLYNGTNANTVIINSGTTSGSYTLTLPLAVGGAGTYLKDAAGDGVLSWAAASGGGGLAGTSVKTIGTSGDYSDVAAFIAGESTPYHGVLVSNVTEDSAVALDGVTYLDLDRYTLTMAANQFTFAGVANIYIRGAGVGSGAEIDYTHGSGAELFNNSGNPTSIVDIQNIVVDNNSTAGNTELSNGVEILDHVKFECPNQTRAGIKPSQDGSSYTNIEINGGGSACEDVIFATGTFATIMENFILTGEFIAGASADYIIQTGTGLRISNISMEHTTATGRFKIGGDITNVGVTGSQALDLELGGSNQLVDNISLNGGTIDIFAPDNCCLSNIISTGSLDLDQAGSTNCKFSNCRFTGALTVGGDRHKFNNCDFLGGGSAPSGALHNIFTGCQFGPDAGGGALTFTFDAGANTNILTSCISDAAIVDNGTSNVVANNVVH